MDTIIYFVAQIVLALTARSTFRLAPMFLYSITVSAFHYFLAAQSVRVLSWYFPCSISAGGGLEQPKFFVPEETQGYWRIVFRNKDLGPKYVYCYWGVIAPRPSQWTELEIHVWILIHAYTTSVYFYIFHLSLCVKNHADNSHSSQIL